MSNQKEDWIAREPHWINQGGECGRMVESQYDGKVSNAVCAEGYAGCALVAKDAKYGSREEEGQGWE